jgi:hypothetical protein
MMNTYGYLNTFSQKYMYVRHIWEWGDGQKGGTCKSWSSFLFSPRGFHGKNVAFGSHCHPFTSAKK